MDLGAGGGTLTCALRCAGLQCLALEKSPGGRASARHLIPPSSIMGGDVLHLPIRDSSLDFAVSSMVIEHVDDTLMARELYRILKPGGIAMITSVLKKPWAWYWRRNAQGTIVLDDSHLREYCAPREFSTLLEVAGFEILSLQMPSIRFPLIDPIFKWLHRLKPNGYWTAFPSSPAGNLLRLLTRIPLPGYHSIEVVARKRLESKRPWNHLLPG
jgi:SAM-dependent methyltransferase